MGWHPANAGLRGVAGLRPDSAPHMRLGPWPFAPRPLCPKPLVPTTWFQSPCCLPLLLIDYVCGNSLAACSPRSGLAFKLRCKPRPLPASPEVVASDCPAPALPCLFQQSAPEQWSWPARRLRRAAFAAHAALPWQCQRLPASRSSSAIPHSASHQEVLACADQNVLVYVCLLRRSSL